jgi:hypothetical protein
MREFRVGTIYVRSNCFIHELWRELLWKANDEIDVCVK